MINHLIFIDGTVSLQLTLGITIVAFVIGYIIKSAIVAKQRKRILSLEDDMLSSHARILSLEKRIADYKSEKNTANKDFDLATHKESNLKIS